MKERFTLLRLNIFCALCRAYRGVDHRQHPTLMLTKVKRVAEGRERSSSVDVVCLNDHLNVKDS